MFFLNKNFRFVKGVISKKESFCGPDLVNIHPTNICNQNCLYCTQHSSYVRSAVDSNDINGSLSFTEIKKLVEQLKEMGTKKILLSGGGEPFLHPDIHRIIEFIKNKGFYCGIITNATVIGRDGAKKILKAGVDDLFVSVGAVDGDSYRKMHGTEEGFEKVKSFLRFFKEKPFRKRPRLTMVNVMNKNNITQADKMVEFAQNYCDRIYFRYLIAIRGLQLLAVSKCQAVDFLKKAKAFKKNIKIHNNLKEFIFHLTYYTFVFERTNYPIHFRLPCYIGWFFSRVDANANVGPCCGKKAFLGNIRQNDFKDIWRCSRYDDFRKNACQLQKDSHWYDKYCLYFCSTYHYNDFINRIMHPCLYLKVKTTVHSAVRKAIKTNPSCS